MIINWFVTPFCNLGCLYCSTSHFVRPNESLLRGQEFLRVASQIRDFGAANPSCLSILDRSH